jgi:hypothetical protein
MSNGLEKDHFKAHIGCVDISFQLRSCIDCVSRRKIVSLRIVDEAWGGTPADLVKAEQEAEMKSGDSEITTIRYLWTGQLRMSYLCIFLFFHLTFLCRG